MNYTWVAVGALIILVLIIKNRMDARDRRDEAQKLSPEEYKRVEAEANAEFSRTHAFEYNQGYRVTLNIYGEVTGAERGWDVPGVGGEPW
jgi:hypothetical protein